MTFYTAGQTRASGEARCSPHKLSRRGQPWANRSGPDDLECAFGSGRGDGADGQAGINRQLAVAARTMGLAIVVGFGPAVCVTTPAVIDTYFDHGTFKVWRGNWGTKVIYRRAVRVT